MSNTENVQTPEQKSSSAKEIKQKAITAAGKSMVTAKKLWKNAAKETKYGVAGIVLGALVTKLLFRKGTQTSSKTTFANPNLPKPDNAANSEVKCNNWSRG